MRTWPHLRPPPDRPSCAAEPEPAWWKNSRLMTAIAGYGSVVFLFNFMDELVPLFASAPRTSVSIPFHGLHMLCSKKDLFST